MFTQEFITNLKKVNVSVDGYKTKTRFEAAWKNAAREQKAQVMRDANVVRATVYRVYETGSISAKMVIAAAQAFDLDPYYLTGESDDSGRFTMERAESFLIERGYNKLIAAMPRSTSKPARGERKGRGKAVARVVEEKLPEVEEFEEDIAEEEELPEAADEKIAEVPAEAECGENCECELCGEGGECGECEEFEVASFTEEELIFLLKAMIIRSKAGEKQAESLKKVISALME